MSDKTRQIPLWPIFSSYGAAVAAVLYYLADHAYVKPLLEEGRFLDGLGALLGWLILSTGLPAPLCIFAANNRVRAGILYGVYAGILWATVWLTRLGP